MNLTSHDFSGRCRILRDSNFIPVELGQAITDADGVTWTLCGGGAPLKEGSPGHVRVRCVGDKVEFPPDLFGLTWSLK